MDAHHRASPTPEALGNVVASIYDAAFDLEKWPAAISSIAALLDGHRALMFVPNMGGRALWASHELDSEMLADYWHYYHSVDIWVARCGPFLARSGTTVVSELIASEAEYVRSEIWNDYCEPLDIFRVACVAVDIPAHAPAAGTLLSVYRSRASDPFGPIARKVLQSLQPHILRSLRFGGLLGSVTSERHYLQAMLAALDKPLLAVSADAHIIFANTAAEAVLRERDGLATEGTRLVAASGALTNNLARAISQSARAHGPGRRAGATLRLPRPLSGNELIVDVLPVPITAGPMKSAQRAPVMLVIHYHNKLSDGAAARFCQAFGLTAAEGKLVHASLEGGTLVAIANRLGIRISTARTQLRGIFAKTHTHRQADLMRLVQGFLL